MSIINPILPNILINGTLADATQVMADFAAIISQVNANAQPLGAISGGALVNIQFIATTGTYNPTTGATKALVFGVGAGGAGGGTPATAGGAQAAGSGGGSGTMAMLYIASSLVSTTVTIGAGGTGVSGAAGGNGGSSSFGGYLILPGGIGGVLGQQIATTGIGDVSADHPAYPVTPSGSGNIIFSTQGKLGDRGFALGNPESGTGGNSWFGSGGRGNRGSGGAAGNGFGAGGSGIAAPISTGAQAGFAGTGAAFLILELA